MAQSFLFGLGDKVKDDISGVSGIVTARFQYITGPNRYEVTPVSHDNKLEFSYFDEDRLTLLQNAGN